MIWLVGLLGIGVGIAIGFFISENIKREEKEETQGRVGVIKQSWTKTYRDGTTWDYSTETVVEELERIGNISRIDILNISGVGKHHQESVAEMIGDYIETDKVSWQESIDDSEVGSPDEPGETLQ